jgi:LysM repeat protein
MANDTPKRKFTKEKSQRQETKNELKTEEHENKVLYILSSKEDSYFKIAKRFHLTLRQLHKYNESIPGIDLLNAGSIIYLAPKRNHSKTKETITLESAMTWREIAQMEAVKLKPLMRKNNSSSPDQQLPKGEKVFLR